MTSPAWIDQLRQVDATTSSWLNAAAGALDSGVEPPANLLPLLTAGGLARIGVPPSLGGSGGTTADAVTAIAEVSSLSLAAGFVLWGHRTYIEYLLQSPNRTLRDRLLPDLLAGRLAGATGLSNAMKFLAGLEDLQISATVDREDLICAGNLPWATNLRVEGFHVAAAVARQGQPPAIVSFAHDDLGMGRSADLDLIALRSTSTASIIVKSVRVKSDRLISGDALQWLPHVRPAFLSLQCGMSLGLARRALHEAQSEKGAGRVVLRQPIVSLGQDLSRLEQNLLDGLTSGAFVADPPRLFQIRIDLAEVAAAAASLELQSLGGRAYGTETGEGFPRRWRESAFIPIITPTLVQLKTALAARPGRQLSAAG